MAEQNDGAVIDGAGSSDEELSDLEASVNGRQSSQSQDVGLDMDLDEQDPADSPDVSLGLASASDALPARDKKRGRLHSRLDLPEELDPELYGLRRSVSSASCFEVFDRVQAHGARSVPQGRAVQRVRRSLSAQVADR